MAQETTVQGFVSGNGALLVIIVGLLILWLGVSGKFDCFGGSLNCLLGRTSAGPAEAATPTQTTVTPATIGGSGALARVTARLNQGAGAFLKQPPYVAAG